MPSKLHTQAILTAFTHIYASRVSSSPIATANTASLPLLISLLDLNRLRHYHL